jgi:hypothetical protein
VFDVSDMYTLADAWGWTWERELKNKPPHRWSQEWEVDLAIKVMQKASNLTWTSFFFFFLASFPLLNWFEMIKCLGS